MTRLDLPPRVALITGAGSGMGQRYAQRLLAQGWRVAALDVNAAGLEALGDQPALLRLVADVRDEQAVRDAVARTEGEFGPLTRVVNAAAVMPLGAVLEQDAATVRRIFDINVMGLVHLSQATMPGMLARGSGEFVSFASLAGHLPIFFMGAYAASKFATVAYTEVLYQENRNHGVHVCCVCPPAVNTPLLEQGRATRWPRALDFYPMIEPDTVLDALDRALRRRRFWVFPGWYTLGNLWSRRLFPGLTWWILRLIEKPGQA